MAVSRRPERVALVICLAPGSTESRPTSYGVSCLAIGRARLCRANRSLRQRPLGTGRDDRLRPIQVPITSLELGFQLHFEPGQIDQVPAREFPAVVTARLMFKSDDEVDSVIPHLVRSHFRFEIKAPETAVATS